MGCCPWQAYIATCSASTASHECRFCWPPVLTPFVPPAPSAVQDYQRYWARFMRLMAQNKSGGPMARGEMLSFQSWRRSIGFE